MSIRIIRINTTEFTAALNEYRQYTKRDISTVLNTKGFYIARRAVRVTHRADKAKIKSSLMEQVTASRNGKVAGTAPLAALIVNARAANAGRAGLYGRDMRKAIQKLVGARVRSAGFIASGFLPSVKAFEPFAEQKGRAPALDREVKQIGQAKGQGIPARDGWQARAVIINSASAERDEKAALERYAGRGLEEAFAFEAASMREYVAGKMQASADKVNAGKK